ncbi:hypothetical protein FLT15_17820 [Paenibacillus thiaminolyticus]|uniref:hypothetical protein n=1 Tax=Paenibacillus thiaminolyticus TaxID=49283 RepID=UPI0011652359|nr:hypothetical protein [Paenibacillus thiaminolyticus]NGP60002.1 hypothetical protein [Paenibacillus thiaminolyticus]NGP60080.1 hypothetical protein [Paenibacillus thiaminolyticus]NGP60116.1 hypothetical protein [Paenibacillus thiaminolyticus]
MTYTPAAIKAGTTYTFKNSDGNIVTRKVLEIDSPRKGMVKVLKVENDTIIEVSTSTLERVLRLYCIGESGGTGE